MTLPVQLPPLGLEGIELAHGEHNNRTEGVCFMEAAAWFAGLPHSDHPECVCPVIGAFGRSLNDRIADGALRTRLLRPLVPVVLNTRSTPEVQQKRLCLVIEWLVRDIMPPYFDRFETLKAFATELRGLPPVLTREDCRKASDIFYRARTASYDYAAVAAHDAAYAYADYAAVAADYAAVAAHDAYADYAAVAHDAAYAAAAASDNKQATYESAADLLRRLCEVKE